MGRTIGRALLPAAPLAGSSTSGGQGAPAGATQQKREPLTRPQIRVLLGLYLGYSSMIFSKAALDVAIPLILEDEAMDVKSTDVGRLLTLCSAFYLFGKLSTGYSVDRLGAKFVFLWLASFTSAALTGLVSLCQDSYRLTLFVCITFIAQSSGWSALTSLVSSWLHPSQYGMAFGFLSTSSRMGDVASKVVLGRVASWGYSWRSLFLIAAGLQMATAAFNQAFIPRSPPANNSNSISSIKSPSSTSAGSGVADEGGGSGEAEEAEKGRRLPVLDKASLSQALWQTLMTQRFWCIAIGMASLHVVMEFDKYLPLYIHKSLNISPGMAAQAAALYPLSQLVALAVAGLGYDRLSPVGKLVTVSGLSFLVFFFYALQCLFRAYELPVADWLYLLLIFMAGLSLAVPYYLPASIFIVELGGKKHCGTLSGILDASGGLAAMVFHSTVGVLASEDRWLALLGILTASAFVGFIASTAFQRQCVLASTTSSSSTRLGLSSLLRPTASGLPPGGASGAGDLRSRKLRMSFEPDESFATAVLAGGSSTTNRAGQGAGSNMIKRGATPAQDMC